MSDHLLKKTKAAEPAQSLLNRPYTPCLVAKPTYLCQKEIRFGPIWAQQNTARCTANVDRTLVPPR